MALHLSFFVLRDTAELCKPNAVHPMTRLDVIECMPLNALLTDVAKRSAQLHQEEQQLFPQPVLRGFMLEQTLPDDHSHKFDTDGYGDPLSFLYADDFKRLPFTEDDLTNMIHHHPDVVAALAYLKTLPADTPVVLYWS